MSSIVILSIVLFFSLVLNGIMYWYSKKVTTKLAFIYDNIGDVSEVIANYRAHLKNVYSMEMFYGDETLKFLLEHTTAISSILESYEDSDYFLEEYEEDVPQQKETEDVTTTQNEKNVFYAGSRRRDS